MGLTGLILLSCEMMLFPLMMPVPLPNVNVAVDAAAGCITLMLRRCLSLIGPEVTRCGCCCYHGHLVENVVGRAVKVGKVGSILLLCSIIVVVVIFCFLF